jgi:hypothetical protein
VAILILQDVDNHEVAAELVFDVSKGSEDVTFLGFVTGLEGPRNGLAGLFAWTCRGCSFHNRSSTVIQPEQAFLARWQCTRCKKVTLVQFRSRANAEWVMQHAVAVAGAAFGETAQSGVVVPQRRRKAGPGRPRRQGVFALVAIPALALILVLALSDLHSVPLRRGRGSEQGAGQSGLTPSARLPGCWVSETGDHSLYFGRIDPVSRIGSYVPIPKSHEPQPWVRFTILHEDVDRAEIVIRDLDADGNAAARSESVLHLPKQGGTLIRVSMAQQPPVLTVYHPISNKGIP